MELKPEIEDILLKECTNQELTHPESLIFEAWLNQDHRHRKIYTQMRMVFLHPKAEHMAKLRKGVWSGLQKDLNAPATFSERIRKISHYWMKIAAVFILGISIGLIAYLFHTSHSIETTSPAEVKVIEKVSLPGQKVTTALPDGTMVKLNADSRILVPDHFTGRTREVTLYGEAFFEVARDESKPFVIRTKDIEVEVLGTSFNVKSYPGKDLSIVSVATGKVAVTDNDERRVDLIPGEKISYDSDSRSMVKEEFEWEEEYGWKENILLFTGNDFTEIKEKLSKWYGVEFTVESGTLDFSKKFTGKYIDPPLNAVLEGLSYVYDFSYYVDKKTVILNTNQKEKNEH